MYLYRFAMIWVWDLRFILILINGWTRKHDFKILPFHGVTDYDIECEYTSIKKKLLNIMDNDEFKAYLKENKFEQLFNPFDSITSVLRWKWIYFHKQKWRRLSLYFLHEYP